MDSESSNAEFDCQPSPRHLKRRRRSIADNCVHPVDSENHNQPKDLTFIADSVNGRGKKAPLSCCECRRLKLKCDRTFPCTSCKKRGCAEICPDGVLVSGKGTRFILANTEKLHGKIQDMSERIRSLEDALRLCHAEHCGSSEGVHPLLQPEFLGIKSTLALYDNTQSLSVDTEPKSTTATKRCTPGGFSSPGTEHGNESYPTTPIYSLSPTESGLSEAELSAEIICLSRNFPLSESGPNPQLREYIRRHLPPRETADYLWEQTRINALWQYNPHPNTSFYPSLAHHCYLSPVHELSPHSLALLFMILAVGCLVDVKRTPDHPDSEKYHRLARASLCEVPVMEDSNAETITALFYEIWYLLVFSDKKEAAGYAWGLMGLTAKLAQSIGLHRNSGRSKIMQEEVEKRRSLFWELLYLDARLSLSLGRPPSLSISHVDCPRPSYLSEDDCDSSAGPLSYQEWKHSFYLHCLAPVIDAISQPSLSYDIVLDLDRRIRDFSIPNYLEDKLGNSRCIVVQKACLSTTLEAALLQLHRQFFTRAISTPEEGFNRRHKYAPSVVAVFLSASGMITSLRDLYSHEPHLAARILGYWSNALSAAVALCLLVYCAPASCLCPSALQELERARVLFRAAKDTCPRAMGVIPILEAMIKKANDVYSRWLSDPEIPFQSRTEDHVEGRIHAGSVKFGKFTESAPPLPQQSPQQQDSFARAHHSLAQCIHGVHQEAKALFSYQNLCQCCATVAHQSEPHWRLWKPRPLLAPVRSSILSEIPMDFDKAHSAANPYANLPIINDILTSPHAYLSSSSPPQEEESLYGEHFPSSTLLPQDELPLPSAPWMVSSTSVVETLNCELGHLNASSDQNWMAFF